MRPGLARETLQTAGHARSGKQKPADGAGGLCAGWWRGYIKPGILIPPVMAPIF